MVASFGNVNVIAVKSIMLLQTLYEQGRLHLAAVLGLRAKNE